MIQGGAGSRSVAKDNEKGMPDDGDVVAAGGVDASSVAAIHWCTSRIPGMWAVGHQPQTGRADRVQDDAGETMGSGRGGWGVCGRCQGTVVNNTSHVGEREGKRTASRVPIRFLY